MLRYIIVYILLVAFYKDAFSQGKRTMFYSKETPPFCSQTMILDSSGIFFHEGGCEGRSDISFGRYSINSDNILSFQYLSFDSISPVRKVIQSQNATLGDSSITLTFYDRYNQALGSAFGILIGDTANKVHESWTDSKGQIELNSNTFKYVSLVQLTNIYGDTIKIEIGNSSAEIYLNLPRVFLIYPELTVSQSGILNLQLRDDGLYSSKTKQLVLKKD